MANLFFLDYFPNYSYDKYDDDDGGDDDGDVDVDQ